MPEGAWIVLYIGRRVEHRRSRVPTCLPADGVELGEAKIGPDRHFQFEAIIPADLPREGYYPVYAAARESSQGEFPGCHGFGADIALCGYLDSRKRFTPHAMLADRLRVLDNNEQY